MASERIPTWVIEEIKKKVSLDAKILNTVSLQKAGSAIAVLANTTKGAVFVRKTRLGEPIIYHLCLPGKRMSLVCPVCSENMELVNPQFPRDIYCSRCGTKYGLCPGGILEKRWFATTPAVQQQVEAPAVVEVKQQTFEGPFIYKEYTLHTVDVTMKNGKTKPFYFFSKHKPKSGKPCPMPEGYSIGESERTGMPFLMKKRHQLAAAGKIDTAPQPQCVALTANGDQCRNSSRKGSKYCAVHKDYRPPSGKQILAKMEIAPAEGIVHTLPAVTDITNMPAEAPREKGLRYQCAAITEEGVQCKNASRAGSRYCTTHKGYRPMSISHWENLHNTKPKKPMAQDTVPSIRKETSKTG